MIDHRDPGTVLQHQIQLVTREGSVFVSSTAFRDDLDRFNVTEWHRCFTNEGVTLGEYPAEVPLSVINEVKEQEKIFSMNLSLMKCLT